MSELWDNIVGKYRKVTDRLGMPIDGGILETVVALNMLGVLTTMSCEGHLDHGLPYPWVDTTVGYYHRLSELLSEFYADRVTAFDRHIIILTGSVVCRIQSQGSGGGFTSLIEPVDRPQKLLEYQQEMADFAAFLLTHL